MKIKELDVVLLKDGREATILEVFEDGESFMGEIADEQGATLDTPIISKSEIDKITYQA